MRRSDFFRVLVYILSIALVFNYFFMPITLSKYSGYGVTTLFEYTFSTKLSLNFQYKYKSDPLILFIIFLIIPLLILWFTFKYQFNFFKRKEYLYVLPLCLLGFFLSIYILFFCICNSNEVLFISNIKDGFLATMINPFLYGVLLLIEICRLFCLTKEDVVWTKIHLFSVISVSIFLELILLFFFSPILMARKSYSISPLGFAKYEKFMRYYYSPFMMMFKHSNVLNYSGKSSSYPYMIIPLLLYFIGFICSFFLKNRKAYMLVIVLCSVAIVFMFIGAIDSLDCFVIKYASDDAKFFSSIGIGFYIVIFLNIFLIYVSLFFNFKYGNFVVVNNSKIE